MKFIDAFEYSYQNRTSDEEFCDPFLLHCRLSDLCNSSYKDKEKVILFYKINKELNLVRAILNKDESISSRYQEVAHLLSEDSFQKLIESIKCTLFPEYKQAQKQIPKVTPAQGAPAPQVQAPTPPPTPYSSTPDTDLAIGCGTFGGIFIAVALVIILACVFNWSWAAWQWIIGIVGGLLLFVVFVGIVLLVENEAAIDFYVFGTILLGACAILNFILLLFFKENYKTIFGCFSVFELIGGTALVIATFDDLEEGWATVQVLETIAVLILFIVGLKY